MAKIIKKAFLAFSSVIFTVLVLAVIISFSAGLVTREKAALVADVLKGKVTSDMLKAPSAGKAAEEELRPADYRRKIEQEMELKELTLNRKEEQLTRMAADIEIQRKDVEQKEADFDRMRKDFIALQEKQKKEAGDAGFKKAVAHLEGLEAASAAETIYQFPEEEIVRYLKAFDDDYASEVIEGMKVIERRTGQSPGAGRMSRVARILNSYYEKADSSK